MKFGQKLVYIILKHLQKNAVENITLSPRKLISKFWSTGATMGGRGLKKYQIYLIMQKKKFLKKINNEHEYYILI